MTTTHTMTLNKKAEDRMKSLIFKTGGGRELTPQASADVIRHACAIYELIVDHWATGGEVILRDADGVKMNKMGKPDES